ncbi:MAG: glycosyltransferase family 39 protein, partial [Patescibacteria group bacterium]|nr:glycosyltransferase family 39 protein [Patescibacteria group bacterium]
MQKNLTRLLTFRKQETIVLVGITLLYIITRIFSLMAQPVFGDEALYIWFARDILTSPHHWFISLVVGRQPLFIWITALFLLVFKNPLFAIRMVSVLSGFATMIGLGLLSYEIFHSKRIVFFTMLLMLFYPFAFVYDRLGILDSMVGAVYVWALYLTFLFAKKATLVRAILLGILLGIGFV